MFKTAHSLAIKCLEIRLELSLRYPPCWQGFMILEDVKQSPEGELSSKVLLICRNYILHYQIHKKEVPMVSIVTNNWLEVTNHYLVLACSTGKTHSWCYRLGQELIDY